MNMHLWVSSQLHMSDIKFAQEGVSNSLMDISNSIPQGQMQSPQEAVCVSKLFHPLTLTTGRQIGIFAWWFLSHHLASTICSCFPHHKPTELHALQHPPMSKNKQTNSLYHLDLLIPTCFLMENHASGHA